MSQLVRGRSVLLISTLVIAWAGTDCSLCAGQEPSYQLQRWTGVERPTIGPDGTIYVSGSFDECRETPAPPGQPSGCGETTPWEPVHNDLYALNPNGTEKWRFTLRPAEASFSYRQIGIGPSGTVYVADEQNLYALDSKGALNWMFPYFGEPSWVDFAPDGTIYFCANNVRHVLNAEDNQWLPQSASGHETGYGVYALKADGALRWRKDSQASPIAGPDGTVYITQGNLLQAVKPDGMQKWSRDLGKDPIRALHAPSSKIGGRWAIYFFGGDKLHAVAPNGTEKWIVPFPGQPRENSENPDTGPREPAIFFADGVIYFCPSSKLLYALNPDGKPKWKFKSKGDIETGVFGPWVGRDGAVYFTDWGAIERETSVGDLYAIRSDGTLRWKFTWNGPPGPHVGVVREIGANGFVYAEEDIGNWGGDLAAIGPDGKKKWEFGEGGFDVALGTDGTIYVTQRTRGYMGGPFGTGTLYALTPAGKEKWSFAPGEKAAQHASHTKN